MRGKRDWTHGYCPVHWLCALVQRPGALVSSPPSTGCRFAVLCGQGLQFELSTLPVCTARPVGLDQLVGSEYCHVSQEVEQQERVVALGIAPPQHRQLCGEQEQVYQLQLLA